MPNDPAPTDEVQYGPDVPTEAELRLLGDLRGKRVLELGCGAAPASIAFAKAGATAIAVDHRSDQLARARLATEEEEVRVELRQGDLADLAFLRADSIDLVFSAGALGGVEDLNRVFRQVHRVLKVGAPLVFSLPHPAADLVDESAEVPVLRRSYFDRSRVGPEGHHHHTVEEIYTGLHRSSYRVDLLLEPQPDTTGPRGPKWRPAYSFIPPVLVVRARKEGS